jgi:hemolysin III
VTTIVIDWHDVVSALTHGLWATLAIPAGLLLAHRAAHLKDKLILLVFTVSMLMCYTSSFLFHCTAEPWREYFRKWDYACIFVLIAGTYTPIVYKFSAPWMMILTWGCAFTGIFIQNYTGEAYDFMYLLMGWGLMLASPTLLRRVITPRFFSIAVGGIFYSIGAVLEWNQVPYCVVKGCVGHHEVFHLFVMLGTTFHYWFFWKDFKYNDRPAVYYKLQSLAG